MEEPEQESKDDSRGSSGDRFCENCGTFSAIGSLACIRCGVFFLITGDRGSTGARSNELIVRDNEGYLARIKTVEKNSDRVS